MGRLSLFSGLDYWTHEDGNEQEYTEFDSSFTDLASFTGLLRSAQYSVQSWCRSKCAFLFLQIDSYPGSSPGSSPCRKAAFGMRRSLGTRLFANCTKLEPVIQRQNPERKASVNYNWRRAAGSTFGVHHDKIRRQHTVRTSKEHLATLGHCITHTLSTCNS